MKIYAINTFNNYANKDNSKMAQMSQEFKGYVNGKFYKDEVIQKAKQALKQPEILKSFKQKSFLDTYKTWHEGTLAESIRERVTVAILTLGISEISWTLIGRLADVIDNAEKKKMLEEILSCMQDLTDEK